jgi:regulator of RNase E activity RraA
LHHNCASVGLISYHSPSLLAGTALTVKTRGGDNLAILRAHDFCRPGHVMVVDARVVLQSQNLAVHVH